LLSVIVENDGLMRRARCGCPLLCAIRRRQTRSEPLLFAKRAEVGAIEAGRFEPEHRIGKSLLILEDSANLALCIVVHLRHPIVLS
jgi:hypothetical protein